MTWWRGKTLRRIQMEAVVGAVADNNGKKNLAAKQLGISLKSVYNILERVEYEDQECQQRYR